MLGAKIDSGALISPECVVAEFDLVQVGKNARIDSSVAVRGFGVDNGAMLLDRVVVGNDATVGTRSVVTPGTQVPASCHLGPGTSSYENEDDLDEKHARIDQQCLPKPNLFLQLCVAGPITFFVNACSLIPPIAVLMWMLHYKGQRDETFSSLSDLMKWLCDPQRIPFCIGIRVARAIVSPFTSLAAAILVKRFLIGKFAAGPLDKSNQWQLTRHYPAEKILSRKRIQDVTDLIGCHYGLVSILYRMLGVKVGKRVFWPGRQPVFSGEFDLLEVGDDVVFGSRTSILFSTGDSFEKAKAVAMKRRKMCEPLLMIIVLSLVAGLPAAPDLEIFDGNYPVSFFFRQTESEASKTRNRLCYEEWAENFSQLNGVMGKMLDEEVLGRSRGQEYFRRFKQEYPRQAVFLHANGGFRKPLADISEYHHGHWLYYNGATVKDSISAEDEMITIRVSNTSIFQLHPYRNNPDLPDDLGLCQLKPDGKPDWNLAEHAVLIAIDEEAGTITLKRSIYADKRRHSYTADKAYVAAHVAQNWGTTNKLWELNMATTCPKDESGRQAADIWAGELIREMSPGGSIDFIDGCQLDVPFIRPISLGRGRRPDADADGNADFGVVNGEHVFTHGVERFFKILAEAFPAKLIMADSGGKSQRSLGYLNGMETEGFPELKDINFNYWSTSINYHRFWNTRSREPRFHYGLMKFLRWERQPTLADCRLIIAGTTLYDAAVPLGDVNGRERWFVMDEILGGSIQKKGWLGKPVYGAVRLWKTEMLLTDGGWKSGNTRIFRTDGQLQFKTAGPKVRDMRFAFAGIDLKDSTDLVIALIVRADHREGLPEGYYRELSMELESTAKLPNSITDTEYVTPVDETAFEAVFYIRDVPQGFLNLNFTMEGNEDMNILAFNIYPTNDATFREYENGAILANPSNEPIEFNLKKLSPGQAYRCLKATRNQDSKTNNGKPVDGLVIVPARDALFLLKD